ncbi:MAG: SHOCT domain-containing protein [Anaerolineae bacterium]|nr:SHOCT domain-containing protein [Anaerolineae bacterium]
MNRRRGGPGIVSTMARTAVVVGTAQAASNVVNNAMAPKPQQVQQQVQQQPVPQQAPQPTGMTQEKVTQLQQIAQLRDQGILTDAEFEVQKAKILNS